MQVVNEHCVATQGAIGLNRIAILGAESSGKSALAQALAKQFSTVWVPEYLREFVEERGRVPCAGDQLYIAKTQMARENAAAAQARTWLFCDTTPMLTALYSRYYFDEIDSELIAMDLVHDYQFTLVTAPDFPWTPDGLQRESPQVRQHIHDVLIETLDERGIPFMLLEGELSSRLEQVQFALEFLSLA